MSSRFRNLTQTTIAAGSDVPLADAGSYFTTDNVEGATQEIGAQLAQHTNKLAGWVDVTQSPFNAVGDGTTDDTEAIQDAIDSLTSGTVFFPPKTFVAMGLVPKSNITLMGYGASLKLPATPANHLIVYNSDDELLAFNVIGITFTVTDNFKTKDLIHINQPTPVAPDKTWYMSVVRDCHFLYGSRGIYCPIPGSVKVEACEFNTCDIGMEWDQEHFYITNTVFWLCRRGIESTAGNHFSIMNGVFAHCDEYGIYWGGFEASILGCAFIDNKLGGIYGSFYNARIEGNRIIQCAKGIYANGPNNMIIGNQISNGTTARDIADATLVYGIEIGSSSHYNIINGNTIDDFYAGIVLTGSTNIVGNNEIESLTDDGIRMNSSNNTLIGNKIRLANIGIHSALAISDAIIVDNFIVASKRHGIYIENTITGGDISNNHIFDNSTETANTYSGIRLANSIVATLIANNIIRNSATGQMKYGVEMQTGLYVSDCLLSNNVARNMKSTNGYVIVAAVTQGTNIGAVAVV